jgi:hypothetical protein
VPSDCRSTTAKRSWQGARAEARRLSKIVSLVGSTRRPLNRSRGPTHKPDQIPPQMWVVRPVGYLSLTRESQFREVLCICIWQLTAHEVCVILFFEAGVKSPAKLVAIEQTRIIAATLSFICVVPKSKSCTPTVLGLKNKTCYVGFENPTAAPFAG